MKKKIRKLSEDIPKAINGLDGQCHDRSHGANNKNGYSHNPKDFGFGSIRSQKQFVNVSGKHWGGRQNWGISWGHDSCWDRTQAKKGYKWGCQVLQNHGQNHSSIIVRQGRVSTFPSCLFPLWKYTTWYPSPALKLYQDKMMNFSRKSSKLFFFFNKGCGA